MNAFLSNNIVYLLIRIIILTYYECNGQSISLIDYITPENCTQNNYYDSSRLRCMPCANGTSSSKNKLICECPIGYATTPNGCEQCTNGKIVSADGHFCIECVGSENQTLIADQAGRCGQCGIGEISIYSISAQNTLKAQICKQCPQGTMASSNQLYCIPCGATDINTCRCKRGNCNNKNIPIEDGSLFTIELEDGTQILSSYIRENINDVYQSCSQGELKSCEHLANLCVLQNYRKQPQSACNLLEMIQNTDRFNSQRNDIPWLFYYNTETSIELSRENAIHAFFNFDSSLPNSKLDILLMQYSLNGSFIGMQSFSDSDIRICSLAKESILFGAKYHQKCTISIRSLLTSNPTPIFLEFYLRFLDENGVMKLYALPILDENIRQNGQFVNRLPNEEISKWIITRRIYFVDGVTLAKIDRNNTSFFIRYPIYISIQIQIQPRKGGRIMPPFVRIRHVELERASTAVAEMELTIDYFMDGTKHYKDVEITMSVLGALSIVWAAICAYSWGRRAGKMIVDVATISKFIFFECGILGDIFLVVITAMAIFITFGYKAQKLPYYVMLSQEQEWSFIAYLISATILKFIAMIHKSLYLMLTKTFFIDWERPQSVVTNDTTKPPSADLTKSVTTAPTVIWRTYLVANEWNELQNYRKTSVAVQMITMIVLLKWLQLENWAAVAPGFSTEHRSPPFTESRLSRFALNSFLYLTIATAQWIFHVLIIERILVDPFHSIIDLCSIANISVLSLTHPLYGYYIHGRSVHGPADTDMAHMNQYLQNERDNLCGNRGLEPGSDLQTFIVCLPKAFRDQFDEIAAKVFTPMTQTLRLSGTEATTAKVQKIAQIHDEINNFLMEFIDHSNTNADYVLRDRTFVENLLDIDFKDTTQNGNFARDNSEMAFSGAFVYGNEWSYLSFELLLFSCIDLATTNSAFAAFITFTFSTLFRKICSVFFTNNLTKSSFVDQRFLF